VTAVFYLHGFASSSQSSKAAFFATHLRERGIELQTPDLNLPDFSTLTITRMVDQVAAAIDGAAGHGSRRPDVILIGSSLGAFVAIQTALRRPDRMARLILLAPALEFGSRKADGGAVEAAQEGGARISDLDERGLDDWKRAGRINVFHYGYGRLVPVHYELYADARRYDCVNAELTMPIQVFQGRQDTVVDPAAVERWAKARPNVELHMLDDDHQLAASLPDIWERTAPYLIP
jgi:pimeloyl-ACP methyl ester carboxylesterase